ncbi:hypothetical protein [Bacillus massilinigeriensis]|uniref:hypothetical protein n=1 Tax=Bacillus massilionigeriensis TaxID=1805475 RepID=UPI000B23B53B|nr:hypothetical protein [Bacillus massilionigeriensis]
MAKKRKKPKFKVGDTVVITMYGTVGKVTDVKWLDGMYVYEINQSAGLYIESSLKKLSEYDASLVEKEHINIVYKYIFGDLVQVKGYGSDLFKIVGFRTEIWRYKEDAWEDVIYEMSRINDGEWLEAGEEEITLIADAENADTFIRKLGIIDSQNKKRIPFDVPEKLPAIQKVEKETAISKEEKYQYINHLLDVYNDYHFLYQTFKDDDYLRVMKMILHNLQNIK